MALSLFLSLPFGNTHALSLRRWTTAISGFSPPRTTIPPAPKIGGCAMLSSRPLTDSLLHLITITSRVQQRSRAHAACNCLAAAVGGNLRPLLLGAPRAQAARR